MERKVVLANLCITFSTLDHNCPISNASVDKQIFLASLNRDANSAYTFVEDFTVVGGPTQWLIQGGIKSDGYPTRFEKRKVFQIFYGDEILSLKQLISK